MIILNFVLLAHSSCNKKINSVLQIDSVYLFLDEPTVVVGVDQRHFVSETNYNQSLQSNIDQRDQRQFTQQTNIDQRRFSHETQITQPTNIELVHVNIYPSTSEEEPPGLSPENFCLFFA